LEKNNFVRKAIHKTEPEWSERNKRNIGRVRTKDLVIIPCSPFKVNGRFGGKYCFQLQGRISRARY
jgi:hypothetical protein